jgi:hypothetical protein
MSERFKWPSWPIERWTVDELYRAEAALRAERSRRKGLGIDQPPPRLPLCQCHGCCHGNPCANARAGRCR